MPGALSGDAKGYFEAYQSRWENRLLLTIFYSPGGFYQ